MKKSYLTIETMLVLTMACLTAFVLWHWRVAFWLGFAFGGIGIFSGYLSGWIAWLWMGLARFLSRISNGVLLSVVYLLVVVPVAVFRRMRKKDELTHFDRAADSNFIERNHLFQKEDFERTW